MNPENQAYRRSISLPQQLPSKGLKSLRQGAIKPGGAAVPAAPAARGGPRLASVSYNPHRGGTPLVELCADLEIAEPQPWGPPSAAVVVPGRAAGRSATARALEIPEILLMIFEQLDALNVIPHELSQRRRKPLSLRHAKLIYGDTREASAAWERAQSSATTIVEGPGAGLHACLLVNRKWHAMARRVLERTVHFSESARWRQFLHSAPRTRPRALIVHKLGDAHQLELDQMAPKLSGKLSWLEFYTCPGIAPTSTLLGGGAITRLVLPGCARVTDRTLVAVSEHCPQLEYLDLRACEQVSDKGLKIIARYCPRLSLLNVGRTNGGELITYKGVKHIARQTQLQTLGLAGCAVDDRAIWEIALNRGEAIKRLSLNNCHYLTDSSIPRILGYTPNLSVLEIRGCTQITNMRPIALFKRFKEVQGQPPLIEGCEVIERRIQHAVQRLSNEIGRQILADCLEWVNSEDEPAPARARAPAHAHAQAPAPTPARDHGDCI